MKTPALIIIKPDGVSKNIAGIVFDRFARAGLQAVASCMVEPSREIAEEHYQHLKGQPFFDATVDYFCGKQHNIHKLPAIVYYGEDAVEQCREIAGATNPEEADPESVRGAFGRITEEGIYENVVHVSSDAEEAEREIKLWLNPEDLMVDLYPAEEKTVNERKKKVWL